MSKYHIDAMKTALVTYRDKKKEADSYVSYVRGNWGDEAADREQERQNKKIQEARAAADKAIRQAYENGIADVEQWGRLSGSNLTDDVKLLDADLVDETEFEKMKTRYAGNATMLLALKKYGERKNAEAVQERQKTGAMPKSAGYNVKDIVTLPDKMENFRIAQAQALDMLDALDGTGKYSDDWGKATGQALSTEIIDHFGEGGNY